MTQVTLNKDEAHLVALYRAIAQVDHKLVGVDDVGGLLQLLELVINLDEVEETLAPKEVKQLLRGFIAGIAAVREEQYNLAVERYNVEAPPWEDEENGSSPTYFEGGHTGGTAVGQGEDPQYVAQTGPRADQEG
jgi:hypothetical protein